MGVWLFLIENGCLALCEDSLHHGFHFLLLLLVLLFLLLLFSLLLGLHLEDLALLLVLGFGDRNLRLDNRLRHVRRCLPELLGVLVRHGLESGF